MAYPVTCIAVCLLFAGMGRVRGASLWSPLSLNVGVWAMVFVSGLLFGGRFYPLSERAFEAWLTWFATSSLIYLLFTACGGPPTGGQKRMIPLHYTPLLVLLLAWLAYDIRSIGLTGPAHFFFNLRFDAAQNIGFARLGLLDRLYPWAFALFVFEQVNAGAGNRVRRNLLWAVLLLYAVATMAKFGLLTPVLAWAIIKGVRGTLPRRRLLLAGPVLLALMVAFQFLRDVKGEPFSLVKIFGVYTYSPLVAFGYMREAPLEAPFGAHVFRLVYVLYDAILGGGEPVSSLQPMIAVPFWTNVYTVMRPFWLDFGMAGVAVGAAVFGVLFGSLHRLAQAGRQWALMSYAGLAIVLVGQFFDDLLFTTLAGQMQFVIAVGFLAAVSRPVTDECGR
ncbi:MAG: oligosaccharide repeat unit polymerase [bacterium]|nr:oligosaccharide repeat unit polymerase [bacterium]